MDLSQYSRSIIGLVFVICLIFIATKFLKRFYIYHLQSRKDKTITLEDILYIDSKTRIILIKRDNIKHLLLIGENKNLLIESIKEIV